MRTTLWLLLCLTVLACGDNDGGDKTASDPDTPGDAAPVCGDGVIEGTEQCDDGDGNSDTADACRLDCRPAGCGDGVKDTGEGCDDGNNWGGDGCSPECARETGNLEVEPNNVPFQAQDLGADPVVLGSLPEGDVDCYAVPGGGEVRATVLGNDDGVCESLALLRVRGNAGNQVLAGGPDDTTGCAFVSPERDAAARALPDGPHAVCIEGLFGAAVPAYRLEVLSSKVEIGVEACTDGRDNDEDGQSDCDDSDCATFLPCAECMATDLGNSSGRALLADARPDSNRSAGSCGGAAGPEFVTSWTAPGTGRFLATSANWDRDVTLYATEGDCKGRELSCEQGRNAVLDLNLEEGDSISIYIDSSGGNQNTGLAILPVTDTCPDVALDDPEAPAELPLTYEFSRTDTLHAGSCTPLFDARWHTFTAEQEGEYLVTTAGSDFDTVLYVMTACDGQELGCNDDSEGEISELSLTLEAGQEIVIGIGAFGGRADVGLAALDIRKTPME
jgi:cysteine-rich repeat protein